MICGTPAFAVTSTIGSDTEEQVEPTNRWIFFWKISLLALATPLSDLHSSFIKVTSSMLPLMPPASLIMLNSSTTIWPYF